MSKFPDVGLSIFSTMTQMANEYQAINLAQGFPNFEVDGRLTTLLTGLVNQNVHQYAPMAGYVPLLEKIGKLTRESYQKTANPLTEILITAGATEGIFATIQALVNPGEEVVILDPCYDCYEAPVVLCNAVPIHIALQNDFMPNWEAIGAAVHSNTRMLIINTPHNPSGKTWTNRDFDHLEHLLEAHPNLLILSDEVYEYIAFENGHISVHHRPKLVERSISVSSFGKSFHITGWKIGYVIACEALMREIKKVHQFLVFSANSLCQIAISEYLEMVDLTVLKEFYQQKRDLFRSLMAETRFTLLPCEGSYFQVVSYAGISEEKDIDFARRLVIDYGVAAIPLSVFNIDGKDDQLIRFCFAKDDATLLKAVEKLKTL